MGRDIAVHVEYKLLCEKGDRWICGDHFKINPFYGTDDEERKEFVFVRFCDRCNSTYFESIEAVAPRRGLPKDITNIVKEAHDSIEEEYRFGESWLTLQELIDFETPGEKSFLEVGGNNQQFAELIESLKDRADEIFGILEWEWEERTDRAIKIANSIRIVFWFSN